MISRKGNIIVTAITIILVIVLFLVLAVVGLNLKKIDDVVTDKMVASFEAGGYNTSVAIMEDSNEVYASGMDWFIFIFFIAIWLGLLVSTYFSTEHPLFFVVFFIIWVVVLTLAGFVSNSWQAHAGDVDNLVVAAEFPLTSWIGDNLMMVVLGMLVSVGLVFFMREATQ